VLPGVRVYFSRTWPEASGVEGESKSKNAGRTPVLQVTRNPQVAEFSTGINA
jgi:hypothetical protein